MSKYILRRDVPNIGKQGDSVTWSEESQLEYARMFGKEQDWEKIRDGFLIPVTEGIYYAEKTVKVVQCNHPMVERIWEFGALSAMPTDGNMKRVLCLKIKDIDEPIRFEDIGNGEAISQAEEYLKQLP